VQPFPSSPLTAPHSLRAALGGQAANNTDTITAAQGGGETKTQPRRRSKNLGTHCYVHPVHVFQESILDLSQERDGPHSPFRDAELLSVFRLQFCTLSKFCLCPTALRMGLHKTLQVQALQAR